MATKTYTGLEKSLKPVVKQNIESIKINDEILIRPIDEIHVENLCKNISECGQITPIIVEEYKKGMFHVVAHAHEFKALERFYQEIRQKDPSVQLEILTRRFIGDEYKRKLIQLSENIMHRPMSMKEIGEQVDKILNLNNGLTQSNIADELGWSKSYISECLSTYKGKSKNRSSTVEQNEKCSTAQNGTEEAISGILSPAPTNGNENTDRGIKGSGIEPVIPILENPSNIPKTPPMTPPGPPSLKNDVKKVKEEKKKEVENDVLLAKELKGKRGKKLIESLASINMKPFGDNEYCKLSLRVLEKITLHMSNEEAYKNVNLCDDYFYELKKLITKINTNMSKIESNLAMRITNP